MMNSNQLPSIIYENPEEDEIESKASVNKQQNDKDSHNNKSRTTTRSQTTQVKSIKNSNYISKENEKNNYKIDLINSPRRHSSAGSTPSRALHFQKREITDETAFLNNSFSSGRKSNYSKQESSHSLNDYNPQIINPNEIRLEVDELIEKPKFPMPNTAFNIKGRIKLSEVWPYFIGLDLEKEKLIIATENPPQKINCFKQLIMKCKRQTTLGDYHYDERDTIYALTQVPYNSTDAFHSNILQSIYKFLLKQNWCKAYDWELIGFQGEPKDDFKGVGIFGAIQMIAIIDKFPSLISEFFNFLRYNQSEWIFCILLVNITKITLDLFKKGTLNAYCNSSRKVLDILNNFYFGIVFHISKELYSQKTNNMFLKKQQITVESIGTLTHDVREYAQKNPGHFFWSTQQLNELYQINSQFSPKNNNNHPIHATTSTNGNLITSETKQNLKK